MLASFKTKCLQLIFEVVDAVELMWGKIRAEAREILVRARISLPDREVLSGVLLVCFLDLTAFSIYGANKLIGTDTLPFRRNS